MSTITAPLLGNQFTADELLTMEDATGYELVDGKLRERNVSKESSRIGATIGRLLGNEASRTHEAEVYGADLGYKCFPPTVDPVLRSVMVHRRDGSVTKLHEHEEITGETALPGFRCRVAELLK